MDIDVDELDGSALDGETNLDALDVQGEEDEKDPQLDVRWGGQIITLRIGELTGLDWQRFRQTLGIGLMEGLRTGGLDAISCVLWLKLRRSNKKLRYVDVANVLTMNDIIDD